MTIFNHMMWVPTEADGRGDLFAMGTGFAWEKLSDLPDSNKIDFETAVEVTALDFPPTVAVRRRIGA